MDFADLRNKYAREPMPVGTAQWLDEGAARTMSRHDGWGAMFDGSSICDVHNRRLGGFASYTVKCGHPRCRATFSHTFYRPYEDAEGADNSASIEALSQGGWGMAAGKSLRCPEHVRVEKKVVLDATVGELEFSSKQIVLQNGARLPMPPEYFATVRAMRGKRVKITITIDE